MSNCDPARVIAVTPITPNMIRVTLQTEDGWAWTTDGFGDERIDIAFPHAGETEADLSFFNQPGYFEGELDYGQEPPWRHYTVRRVHEGGSRFDVDFVVHEGGHASDWARRAEPGHLLGVFGGGDESRAHYRRVPDTDFQLLVADATGLPGLGRIIEELEPGARAHAIIEVGTAEDVQELTTAGDVTYTWLVGSGMGHSPSALADAVAAVAEFDPARSYAWVACEAATSRAVRSHLRKVRGLARDRHNAIGYWSEGQRGHVRGINAEAAVSAA